MNGSALGWHSPAGSCVSSEIKCPGSWTGRKCITNPGTSTPPNAVFYLYTPLLDLYAYILRDTPLELASSSNTYTQYQYTVVWAGEEFFSKV